MADNEEMQGKEEEVQQEVVQELEPEVVAVRDAATLVGDGDGDADADGARELRQKRRELEGQVKSAKAELVRLQCQLRDFSSKHFRQMEHLRFLINNRLHAKAEDPADSERERATPATAAATTAATAATTTASAKQSLSSQKGEDTNEHADWKEAIKPIGYLKSCFKRKNGTPRQANLCPDSAAYLQVTAFSNSDHALEGLAHFSHVWLVFYFHLNDNISVKAKIRPPKLDGVRVGVMSTRSPHRPNPIGLSLVELAKVQGDTLFFNGIDLVDGTPILDVKPYIPFYDAPPSPPTIAPWVHDARLRELPVVFTDRAQADIAALVDAGQLQFFSSADTFKQAVLAILRADPRSSYRREKCREQTYAFTLDATDIIVKFEDDVAHVLQVKAFRPKKEKTAGHLSQEAAEVVVVAQEQQSEEAPSDAACGGDHDDDDEATEAG
ncbi:hypothetical protein PTSG_12526 [Salpingoeca rosetta]|uniref:TsaA-like domain-containing protein n=1 Tax=Salpingoeca rosetta (strain ATCC 50818 / BSB-021) TaxID=946362 RepID=F2UDT1_SALR5|nr:uncharacterized protein PTSG_12526 [Salpingoeca rosetta]EGD74781.1 hypothetical protein PTSG_12526 [Salpingoeca rosetta]|eukprot:XP_004992426.1 hypothetical protein PTSG_12526 [Salpingoeca rosetta]